MGTVYAKHQVSGEVYVVDLDMDRKGQPVTGVCGPLHYDDYAGLDEFLMGRYKNVPDSFDLNTEDVDWMEDEFIAGRVKVVGIGELLLQG